LYFEADLNNGAVIKSSCNSVIALSGNKLLAGKGIGLLFLLLSQFESLKVSIKTLSCREATHAPPHDRKSNQKIGR